MITRREKRALMDDDDWKKRDSNNIDFCKFYQFS